MEQPNTFHSRYLRMSRIWWETRQSYRFRPSAEPRKEFCCTARQTHGRTCPWWKTSILSMYRGISWSYWGRILHILWIARSSAWWTLSICWKRGYATCLHVLSQERAKSSAFLPSWRSRMGCCWFWWIISWEWLGWLTWWRSSLVFWWFCLWNSSFLCFCWDLRGLVF